MSKRRLLRRKSRRPTSSSSKFKAKSHRYQKARQSGLAALNRVRKGQSKSLSHAARIEHTSVKTILHLFPGAVYRDRLSGLIQVRPTDRYRQKVEILTNQGPVVVSARGSRERELAGRHRADVFRVLEGREPKSTLRQYRGKTVGGHKLISDFGPLSRLAQAGILEQLDSLYVSPGVTA